MFILHDIITDDRIALNPTVRIGRFQGDLKLKEDTQVSKSHCLIETFDDVVRITDLGSTNGTFVNKEKLNAHEPRPLIPGDLIQIGRTEFKLEREDESSFNIDLADRSIKLTGESTKTGFDEEDPAEVTGNIARTEILEKSPLPPEDPVKKVDLNNPVHLSLVVFIGLQTILLFLGGSFDFNSKYSPINFVLAEVIGIVVAAVLTFTPMRLWFHHFPKKVPAIPIAIVILFAVQQLTYGVMDGLLNLSQQKQINQIYTQCLVIKNREACIRASSTCPLCLEKLTSQEALRIQDFMSQVSDM